MSLTFRHIALELVVPDWNSNLADAIRKLDHMRKFKLGGSTNPVLFFQLKSVFHLLESVGSARIEGNRTTVAEYVEQKLESGEKSSESFHEIANVEEAMIFIEDSIEEGSDITEKFIRELHSIIVGGLSPSNEGDNNPGSYRDVTVEISQSEHSPPICSAVAGYMGELVCWVNETHAERDDLLKVAIAHHRFAWIHPFRNGNGRVVRALTYAMLIKYGFQIKHGQLLNPTAVFCSDREKYYEMLAKADTGESDGIKAWCEYVLMGISEEMEKISVLLDHKSLVKRLLNPAIKSAAERKIIGRDEAVVLKMAIQNQTFKLKDVVDALPTLTTDRTKNLLNRMKTSGLVTSIKPNGREYCINFRSRPLLRSIIETLEKENFIPSF
jgi:Fic family protein